MTRLGHVPALDGLRGIAILLVLAAHVLGWSQGALGVDLFFVLSGFLITTLLLEERARSGTIRFAGFYARRARRLLPALIVFLAAFLTVNAARGVDALDTVARYGLYLGNFAAANDAAAVDTHSLPAFGLSHLWSLATEEQFYLLWPVMLAVILKTKRPLRWTAAILLAAELVRSGLAVHGADPGHLYYLPVGHAQGLIVGAAAAVYRLDRGFTASNSGTAIWAAAAVGLVILSPGRNEAFFAVWLPLVEIAFVMLVIAAVSQTHLAAALSWRPLVYVGLISYSLYLWHFMFRLLFDYHQPLAQIALSVACAVLSYRFVEQPFRRRRTYFAGASVVSPGGSIG